MGSGSGGTYMNRVKAREASGVIVVGAGLIGLACAWELAGTGAKVTVVEREEPGCGATRVAAGMLAPIGELDFGEPELLELNLRSRRLYPDFVATLEAATGLDTGYRHTGALHVALDRDEAGELRRIMELQHSYGLDPKWLGPMAARELEAGISPSLAGAVLVEEDAVVDPRALTAALRAGLEDRGVRIVTGEVTGLVRDPAGKVTGTETTRGRFDADLVVAAPGAFAGIANWLPDEIRPPVRPVKGQTVELRGDVDEPVCERILGSERVYIAPRPDGRVILGATSEEMGFDTRVTGGGVHELLREAYRLLPDVAEMEFVGAIAGLRPGTPDNLPLIGPTAIEGLILATGHYRNGILLAPLTAKAVGELAVGGEPEWLLASSPARFEHQEAR
ncbi:MAG: glycine oxidase ThiO [Solirubrobacterales bacterium]|nr:glycine oxidase ThiO [Solirubrobacterales bacterium]MCB8915807.1 glycine oxidase ThiO [Thermoleophilales bacterium]